ncbi:hypothetical protein CE91St64_18000 [Faecalicatena contorta]|nr:hypothetical protein CE91St64_18000 [Faecalicatena contorta]
MRCSAAGREDTKVVRIWSEFPLTKEMKRCVYELSFSDSGIDFICIEFTHGTSGNTVS